MPLTKQAFVAIGKRGNNITNQLAVNSSKSIQIAHYSDTILTCIVLTSNVLSHTHTKIYNPMYK